MKCQLIVDIPSGIEQGVCVALCSSVGIVSKVVAGKSVLIKETITLLLNDENKLAVFDLSEVLAAGISPRALADSLMNRKVIGRAALVARANSLHNTERAWLADLGFANVFGDLDPNQPEADTRRFANWLTSFAKTEPLSEQKLRTYLRAVPISLNGESARAKIRRLTGQTTEAVTAELQKLLTLDDRRFHLRSYPACFVGTEAIQVMRQRWSTTTAQCVEIGSTLASLGLIYHVAHDQPFQDSNFFYRLVSSRATENIQLQTAINALLASKATLLRDRQYGATQYPECLVGSEAVTCLVNALSLSRLDAAIVLNRLANLGLLRHVLLEHRFEDANLFYRLS